MTGTGVIMWVLRIITGRRKPDPGRIAGLHRAMGLMPDGSPGGFTINCPDDTVFVRCRTR